MPTLKLLPIRVISTPCIELSFFRERHVFIVDTGASHSCISYALFNKFPLTEQHYRTIKDCQMQGSAGKRSTFLVPFKIRILDKITDTVSVGHFLDEWHKEEGVRFSGVLGQDVMTQFKQVLIDYEVGTISFVDR